MATTKCAFKGRDATTEQPAEDGWTVLESWRGMVEGYYCPAHADAVEKPPDGFRKKRQKPSD
jgi:hypothetical protein